MRSQLIRWMQNQQVSQVSETGECHPYEFLFDLLDDIPKIKQFILKPGVYMLSLHDHLVGCKSYLKSQDNLKLSPGLFKIQLRFIKLKTSVNPVNLAQF